MKNELVTIISSVYNCELYLNEFLESVINQTYKNLEIIIINDGSTDKSKDIIEKYEKKDNRIKLISKEKIGVSLARNIGLKMATGKYIYCADSDDILELDIIQTCIKKLQQTNTKAVILKNNKFNTVKKFEDMFVFEDKIYKSKEVLKKILEDEQGSQIWKFFVQKELWENIEFPINQIFEDISTTYKLFLTEFNVAIIIKPMYNYRLRNSSISFQNKEENKKSIYYAFKDRFEYLSSYDIEKEYIDKVRNKMLIYSMEIYNYSIINNNINNLKKENEEAYQNIKNEYININKKLFKKREIVKMYMIKNFRRFYNKTYIIKNMMKKKGDDKITYGNEYRFK